MSFRVRRGLLICLALTACWPVVALDAVDVVFRRDAVPQIDGRVTPEEKAGATSVSMTVMGSLDKPKFSTDVFVAFLNDGFYAGFVAADPDPGNLVTRVTQDNGPVFTDDSVQLLLCPDKETDRSNYFHFAVNAAGVRYSMDMDRDRPVAAWEAATQKTADGWEAEIFVPYTKVRYKTLQGFWRANVARVRAARDGAPEETSVWVNPGTTLHNFRRFGFMRIVDPSAPARNQSNSAPADTSTTPAAAETTSSAP